MRPDPARENMVSVYKKMMRRNCCSNAVVTLRNKVNGILRCNMFHHDIQFGMLAFDWLQNPLDKYSLSIENINVRIGHFAVHTKGHPMSAIVSSVSVIRSKFVTPEAEFVVAPAG